MSDAVTEWAYYNEGMCNILLQYTGKSENYVGKLLRVRKRPVDLENGGILGEYDILSSEIFECEAKFQRNVMQKLLGDEFVILGHAFPVTRRFLQDVNMRIRLFQPLNRQYSRVDERAEVAIMVDDCSNTNMVEIKPKAPIITNPSPLCVWKETNCRFCLMQHWKVDTGRATRRSSYCPADLFSQSPLRVRKAIESLIQDPQNNWRAKGEVNVDAICAFLCDSPILARLGSIIVSCPLDICVLKAIWERLGCPDMFSSEWRANWLDHGVDGLPALPPIPVSVPTVSIAEHCNMGNNLQEFNHTCDGFIDWVHGLDVGVCQSFLQRFLLSRTAMDVSIILQLDNEAIQGTVIDTDERHTTCLKRYFEQDGKMPWSTTP